MSTLKWSDLDPRKFTAPPKPPKLKDRSPEGVKTQLYNEALNNLSYIADKAGFGVGEFLVRLCYADIDKLKKLLFEKSI